MNKKVVISEEKREEMKMKIANYFSNERDEELGVLACGLILDFFVEELGYIMYNQGLEDAQIYIRDKLDDLYALQIIKR